MSGDNDQTDQVSHGCFLRHCSKGNHLPWARISGVYPTGISTTSGLRSEVGGFADYVLIKKKENYDALAHFLSILVQTTRNYRTSARKYSIFPKV